MNALHPNSRLSNPGRRFTPAGALTDDIRAELNALADNITARLSTQLAAAARAAADEITPTIRDTMADPEFGKNMGVGVVQELQKPASAALVTQVGQAAGSQIARFNPVILTVGALGVFAVGVAAGYLINK